MSIAHRTPTPHTPGGSVEEVKKSRSRLMHQLEGPLGVVEGQTAAIHSIAEILASSMSAMQHDIGSVQRRLADIEESVKILAFNIQGFDVGGTDEPPPTPPPAPLSRPSSAASSRPTSANGRGPDT